MRQCICGFVVGAIVLSAGQLYAEDGLFELSLSDLKTIEVTSVSKKPQPLNEAAAAITVVTADDIRRSGATSIPEALRLAPGVNVAQIDANKWAVSVRGFNGRIANKLLVLIDGRTVYSSTFSGVFWNNQFVPLSTIDRIEIIRGPGAAVWGSNAVNGVINIITRHAKQTQGSLAEVAVGTEHSQLALRHGGTVGPNGFYRLHAAAVSQDDAKQEAGGDQSDEWVLGQVGFRVDMAPNSQDRWLLTGQAYRSSEDNQQLIWDPSGTSSNINEEVQLQGMTLLGEWSRTTRDDHEIVIKGSVEARDSDPDQTIGLFFIQTELEARYRLPVGQRQEWSFGGVYRHYTDDFDSSFTTSLVPSEDSLHSYSLFVQDDIELAQRWNLTLGLRADHGEIAGWELQPNARMAWRPTDEQTLWASVSRAVRSPSRAEVDGRNVVRVIPAMPPMMPATTIVQTGNPDFKAEELVAFEGGYRWSVNRSLTVDLAAFLFDYDNLRTFEQGAPQPEGMGLTIPILAENEMRGRVYGAEIAFDIRPFTQWRLQPMYSWLKYDLTTSSASNDTTTLDSVTGSSPTHQWAIRSSHDLPHNVQFDLWLKYVGPLFDGAVPAYWGLDARLGWRPTSDLEIALIAQNILDGQHPEFVPDILQLETTEIERGAYLKVTYRF